jgi:hypothetical protein
MSYQGKNPTSDTFQVWDGTSWISIDNLTVQDVGANSTITASGSLALSIAGSVGTAGQVLTSNGATASWQSPGTAQTRTWGTAITAAVTVADPGNNWSMRRVTAGTSYQIDLPATPTTNAQFTFKVDNQAATNNITISGNGKNIDNGSSIVMAVNDQALTLSYNGTQWFVV